MWTEANALPHSIDDAYLDYDLSALSGEGFNSLCLPKENDAGCYSKTQSQCTESDACDWTNILDSYTKDGFDLEQKLNPWLEYNSKSILGYYCGSNATPWGRLEKVRKDPASALCTWQDCYNRLSNTGTVDVLWDEESNTCTALKSGNTNTGIQSKVKCEGPGNPCSSCTEADDYVSCIKCNKENDPCKECANNTDYIPSGECTSTIGWTFRECQENNHNVLKYDANETNIGNCPWGCNNPDSQGCLNTVDDPPYIFGMELDGTNEVCYSDGQINVFQPNLWRAQTPPSGKACSIQDPTSCNNPGKAICTSSKAPCNEGEAGCYATKEQCETLNNCQPGWLRNNDGTDCNIFQCTSDGSLADRNVPSGQVVNNATDIFHVNEHGGACIRTNPKVDPNERDYCRVFWATCAGSQPISSDKIGMDYHSKCKYRGTDCAGSAQDTHAKFDGENGGPEYKFCYKFPVDYNDPDSTYRPATPTEAEDGGGSPCTWGGNVDGSASNGPGIPPTVPSDGIPLYP
jgi:hypothetical protein